MSWLEHVEENLDLADKLCPEMRDKTANLSRAKVTRSLSLALSLELCVLQISKT